MMKVTLASFRIFVLSLLAYLVARCAWDWKKLSHSQHPASDFWGILFQGIIATVCFYFSRRIWQKQS